MRGLGAEDDASAADFGQAQLDHQGYDVAFLGSVGGWIGEGVRGRFFIISHFALDGGGI